MGMDGPSARPSKRSLLLYSSNGPACIPSPGQLMVRGVIRRDQLFIFQECIEDLVKAPQDSATFDFSACEYLSSIFIGHLVDGILRARSAGKRVHVQVSPALGGFFQMAHLDQLFDYTVEHERGLRGRLKINS